jgi:hypothetical protein
MLYTNSFIVVFESTRAVVFDTCLPCSWSTSYEPGHLMQFIGIELKSYTCEQDTGWSYYSPESKMVAVRPLNPNSD